MHDEIKFQSTFKMIECSSVNTIMNSLSGILHLNSNDLKQLFYSIGPIPRIEEPKSYVNRFISLKIKLPSSLIPSIWYHATRVIEPKCFTNEGILPKKLMKPKIYTLLHKLSAGKSKYGENPFSNSINAKNWINDEGPFAFLCRTVAINAPGCTHSYCECPELVEDIAGSLLGKNYKEIVDKFKSMSKPCIVTFWANSELYALESAIYYAYLLNMGCTEVESAESANTCYDGKGKIIDPSTIIRIELL